MWKLLVLDKAKQWCEAGRFGSITAATRCIIQLEEYDGHGLHLEFHLCTITDDDDANDADALGISNTPGNALSTGSNV